MITRRQFLLAAGSAGALGMAVRGAARRRGAPAWRAARTADAGGLRILQGPPGTPPGGADEATLLWRLGADEWLDPRRLHACLLRRPGVRIHAVLGGGNRLLLVDALRQHGGTLLRERWSPVGQRWTVTARAGGTGRRPGRAALPAMEDRR
jgi:hypothetical protein